MQTILVVLSLQHLTLTESVCMCLLLALCCVLPDCCVHLLAEFPIGPEKLGQWADEIWDAVGWDTLQAEERLQAVFSRTLQTSGQNVYCHTEGLSAALNFDWENKTKKQKKKCLSLLPSPLSHQAMLGIALLGSFQVRNWWAEQRREEERTPPGKLGYSCGFLNSLWDSVSGGGKWNVWRMTVNAVWKKGGDWGGVWDPAQSSAVEQWKAPGRRRQNSDCLRAWIIHWESKTVLGFFRRCPATLTTTLPGWSNPDHVSTIPSFSQWGNYHESTHAHMATCCFSAFFMPQNQTYWPWLQPLEADPKLRIWLCPE